MQRIYIGNGNYLEGLMPGDIEFIKIHAIAFRIAVSEQIVNGVGLSAAKREMREIALSGMKFIDPYVVSELRRVIDETALSDLTKEAQEYLSLGVLKTMEENRGKKAGRIERWFYLKTGHLFWYSDKNSKI